MSAVRPTGFVGRAAVFEVMTVDEDRRDVVRTGTTDEIAAAAGGPQAMPPLAPDGIRLVLAGVRRSTRCSPAVTDLTGSS